MNCGNLRWIVVHEKRALSPEGGLFNGYPLPAFLTDDGENIRALDNKVILIVDGDSGAGILVVHHFVFNLDGNHLIIIADCDDSAGLSFFLGGVGDVKAGSRLCFSFLNLDQDSVLQRFDGHLEPSRKQYIVAIGDRCEPVTQSPEKNIRKGESGGQVKTCLHRYLPYVKSMGILSSNGNVCRKKY